MAAAWSFSFLLYNFQQNGIKPDGCLKGKEAVLPWNKPHVPDGWDRTVAKSHNVLATRAVYTVVLFAHCLLCPSSQTLGYNYRKTATEADFKEMVFFHGKKKKPTLNKITTKKKILAMCLFLFFFFGDKTENVLSSSPSLPTCFRQKVRRRE